MQNVGPTLRAALVTITAASAVVALARSRHPPARREAGWLAAFLAAIAARLVVPRGGAPDALVAAAVLATSGCLLLAIHDRPGGGACILKEGLSCCARRGG